MVWHSMGKPTADHWNRDSETGSAPPTCQSPPIFGLFAASYGRKSAFSATRDNFVAT